MDNKIRSLINKRVTSLSDTQIDDIMQHIKEIIATNDPIITAGHMGIIIDRAIKYVLHEDIIFYTRRHTTDEIANLLPAYYQKMAD